jgi:hypothetical protein
MRQLPSKKCKVRFWRRTLAIRTKNARREHIAPGHNVLLLVRCYLVNIYIYVHIFYTHSISDVRCWCGSLSFARTHTHTYSPAENTLISWVAAESQLQKHDIIQETALERMKVSANSFTSARPAQICDTSKKWDVTLDTQPRRHFWRFSHPLSLRLHIYGLAALCAAAANIICKNVL